MWKSQNLCELWLSVFCCSSCRCDDIFVSTQMSLLTSLPEDGIFSSLASVSWILLNFFFSSRRFHILFINFSPVSFGDMSCLWLHVSPSNNRWWDTPTSCLCNNRKITTFQRVATLFVIFFSFFFVLVFYWSVSSLPTYICIHVTLLFFNHTHCSLWLIATLWKLLSVFPKFFNWKQQVLVQQRKWRV